MTPDTLNVLFIALAALVVPFWLLMVLLPGWSFTQRTMASFWTVVPTALAYVAIVTPQIATLLPQVVYPDPREQAAFFATQGGYLAISSHVVALDLFLGRWVYLDGMTHRLSPWKLSPILFLVMMLGPLGLLAYLVMRPRSR